VPRLRLGFDDLERLAIGATLGPLGESLLSVEALRGRRPSPLTAEWEQAVRSGVAGWVGPLLAMTSADVLVALRWYGDLPPRPRPLGTDDGGGLGRPDLLAVLRRYHTVAVEPYWPSILAHLEAERSRLGRVMAEHGVGQLLSSAHPRVRWRPPFLEVDAGGQDSDPHEPIVIDRASVALVPSVFCINRPRFVPGDEDSPCLVIYPTVRSLDDATSLWTRQVSRERHALASLLGRTRAWALAAIADTCSTTELAHRIGVSPATASHHTAALRSAGLVASRRDGNAASHRLTALGTALLGADDAKNRRTPMPGDPRARLLDSSCNAIRSRSNGHCHKPPAMP
jgi:DNA-binding transcriptional ArsR family regulator